MQNMLIMANYCFHKNLTRQFILKIQNVSWILDPSVSLRQANQLCTEPTVKKKTARSKTRYEELKLQSAGAAREAVTPMMVTQMDSLHCRQIQKLKM